MNKTKLKYNSFQNCTCLGLYPLKNVAYESLTLLEAIRHSLFSQSMYFHGILLTLALKHGDRSKDRSKVFYIQKTGTAVLEFCRTIGCPSQDLELEF